MKYLINYVEDKQTEAFTKYGAFFAFSNKQFDEQKKEGIKYVSIPGGLICPKENALALIRELNTIQDQGIKEDIEENGKEGIIKRELDNHEAYYTGDIEGTVDALTAYKNITLEDIQKVFKGKHLNPIY
jgi:hypothetical protein